MKMLAPESRRDSGKMSEKTTNTYDHVGPVPLRPRARECDRGGDFGIGTAT